MENTWLGFLSNNLASFNSNRCSETRALDLKRSWSIGQYLEGELFKSSKSWSYGTVSSKVGSDKTTENLQVLLHLWCEMIADS